MHTLCCKWTMSHITCWFLCIESLYILKLYNLWSLLRTTKRIRTAFLNWGEIVAIQCQFRRLRAWKNWTEERNLAKTDAWMSCFILKNDLNSTKKTEHPEWPRSALCLCVFLGALNSLHCSNLSYDEIRRQKCWGDYNSFQSGAWGFGPCVLNSRPMVHSFSSHHRAHKDNAMAPHCRRHTKSSFCKHLKSSSSSAYFMSTAGWSTLPMRTNLSCPARVHSILCLHIS